MFACCSSVTLDLDTIEYPRTVTYHPAHLWKICSEVNFVMSHQLFSQCSKLSLYCKVRLLTSARTALRSSWCCALCQHCCFASAHQHKCDCHRRRFLVTLQLALDVVQHLLNSILFSSSMAPCHQAQARIFTESIAAMITTFSFGVCRPICSERVVKLDHWFFSSNRGSVRQDSSHHADLAPRTVGALRQLVLHPSSCCRLVGVSQVVSVPFCQVDPGSYRALQSPDCASSRVPWPLGSRLFLLNHFG